jgi:hypothetical protein
MNFTVKILSVHYIYRFPVYTRFSCGNMFKDRLPTGPYDLAFVDLDYSGVDGYVHGLKCLVI